MTNTVIQLTHCVDAALIARLFARFRGRYGNLWTSRATSDADWEFIIDDWLQELSKFTLEQVRAAVNKTLSEFTTYPPTLGQLVELCMKESGVPEAHDIIRLLADKNFNHPMVKIIYDKLGSWTLNNAKSEEIERKVKEHYQSARSEFYVEPKKAWEALESFNSTPKELPPPPKNPTAGESKSFRESMNKCQEILLGKKINACGKTYKEFDENKIKPDGRDFDRDVYNEWRDYLLSIPETETMILPPKYAYARMKFIGAKEQPNLLRKAGYNPNPQGQDKSDLRRSNGPSRMYNNYADI